MHKTGFNSSLIKTFKESINTSFASSEVVKKSLKNKLFMLVTEERGLSTAVFRVENYESSLSGTIWSV